jgi:hypothetical protein
MHDSFLTYSSYRWLWITILLLLGCVVAYVWHAPVDGPNGGSWLGYTLGTIGAVLILWLMWFGMRKRSYSSNVGVLRGWLSAHVYLGTSLIVIATLHAGFQVGWNIHTLAYAMMMLVIFSGFFGIFAYLRYPTLMTKNRTNATRGAMLEEIAELDAEAMKVAAKIGDKVHSIVIRSIENTRLGGGVWAQLTAHDGSAAALDRTKELLDDMDNDEDARPATQEMPTMFAMVDFLAASGGEKSEDLRQLLDALSRKKSLATKVAQDVQLQALMEIWLYIHVPLTFGLIAALTAHIVSVFYYW